MTKGDYVEKDSTLAFALAIHLAFRNNLAIVGMSLDDEYLREQINDGRGQIDRVFWFNNSFRDDQLDWAEKAIVQVIETPWQDFWRYWTQLGVEINEEQLHVAWWLALTEAAAEAQGGRIREWAQTMKAIDSDKVQRCLQLSGEYGEQGPRSRLGFGVSGCVQAISLEIEVRFKLNVPTWT